MVLARFPDFNNENVTFRPGLVVGIYEVEILRDKTLVSHFIAKIRWLKNNDQRDCFKDISNIEVWSTDFESHSQFIPAKFITGRVATYVYDIDVTQCYASRIRLVDRVNFVIALPTRSILSSERTNSVAGFAE